MTSTLVVIAAILAAQGEAVAAPGADSGSKVGESSYIDLEGGLGYSTNPYFSLAGGGGHAFVRASAHAVHTRYSARSTTTLSAYGESTSYLGGAGSQKILSLNAHHDAAVTEKLRVFGDLTGSLDENGQLTTRFLSVGPVVEPPSPVVPLPTLPDTQTIFLLSNGRTYRLGGQAGAQLALNAVSSVTARTGVEHVVLRGTGLDNSYNVYLASAGYDRKLNARASAGAVVDVQRANYRSGGRVSVVTPQVTGHLALSDRTDLSGAVGVSSVTLTKGAFTQHSTGLAFNGSLCRRGESDQFCVAIAREQQTASIAGPVTLVSASLNYAKQLGAKQTVQFTAGVSRSSQPFNPLLSSGFVGRASNLTGGASYTRALGSRLFTGANLSFRKLFSDGPTPKADVSGSLFLRIRLGDRQ